MSYNELEFIISEIEKIESVLDNLIKNSDFEELSKSLDRRYALLEQLEDYKTDPRVLTFVNDILEKDIHRHNLIKEQIEKLKNNQLEIQKSKKAMKNGYLKVEEEIRRHDIDKSS
ncbi:MAG TPA: hypothetical protein PK894_01690 [Defluviitoga sp.]|nr:hypothetical protein [Defluviitoga sp.]HOP23977.1 hypothetical protein [Defluviitoga sp.]HPZ28912.1 hypothetical protein [Defluviitoga sp.]HQD62298.1 hypothetical protein [Defluviitoga sp.]